MNLLKPYRKTGDRTEKIIQQEVENRIRIRGKSVAATRRPSTAKAGTVYFNQQRKLNNNVFNNVDRN